jgi:hypothetical protein
MGVGAACVQGDTDHRDDDVLQHVVVLAVCERIACLEMQPRWEPAFLLRAPRRGQYIVPAGRVPRAGSAPMLPFSAP